ncbi:hypothetical protein FQR65_LT06578 [Abscondita terminalis]|nr:hypothetical protein FQR65_LT06578 [Abscondita terminalis]
MKLDQPNEIDWKIKDLLPHDFVDDRSAYVTHKTQLEVEETLNIPSIQPSIIIIETPADMLSNNIADVMHELPSCSGSNTLRIIEMREETNVGANVEENVYEVLPTVKEENNLLRTQSKPNKSSTASTTKKNICKENEWTNVMIEQAREMHEVKMRNEREYHAERMRLLRERDESSSSLFSFTSENFSNVVLIEFTNGRTRDEMLDEF